MGFTIPNDAVIDGIYLEVNGRSENGNVPVEDYNDPTDGQFPLLWIDGVVSNGENSQGGKQWPGTYGIIDYGGATDLWQNAWTPAIINSDSFGAAICMRGTGGTAYYALVDFFQITIYYTESGGGVQPVITQLTPDWLANGQPNNSITLTGGEAQGPGSKVEVTDGSTTVEATVGSWTDTLISDITYNTTGINLGEVSVLVTNDSGNTSAPAAATHVATLPSTGLVTSEDLNARMMRPATQALSPTEDPEFTAHVSNTAIGETIIIPSAGVS